MAEVGGRETTHFDRLGLEAKFAIDRDALEREYLERSRALHPDYHSQSSTAEQQASLELTAALNQAYTLLKKPFRRADYLLSLHGGPTAAEHKEMSPGFLEEMLELRMEIEELRESANHERTAAMEQQLDSRRSKLLDNTASAFAKLESSETKDAATLREIREHLNASKYIEGLLRDLRAD